MALKKFSKCIFHWYLTFYWYSCTNTLPDILQYYLKCSSGQANPFQQVIMLFPIVFIELHTVVLWYFFRCSFSRIWKNNTVKQILTKIYLCKLLLHHCFVEAVRKSQSIGGDAGWCGRATEISNTWLCQCQGVFVCCWLYNNSRTRQCLRYSL